VPCTSASTSPAMAGRWIARREGIYGQRAAHPRLPFRIDEIADFVQSHGKVFLIEQNPPERADEDAAS